MTNIKKGAQPWVKDIRSEIWGTQTQFNNFEQLNSKRLAGMHEELAALWVL